MTLAERGIINAVLSRLGGEDSEGRAETTLEEGELVLDLQQE